MDVICVVYCDWVFFLIGYFLVDVFGEFGEVCCLWVDGVFEVFCSDFVVVVSVDDEYFGVC